MTTAEVTDHNTWIIHKQNDTRQIYHALSIILLASSMECMKCCCSENQNPRTTDFSKKGWSTRWLYVHRHREPSKNTCLSGKTNNAWIKTFEVSTLVQWRADDLQDDAAVKSLLGRWTGLRSPASSQDRQADVYLIPLSSIAGEIFPVVRVIAMFPLVTPWH